MITLFIGISLAILTVWMNKPLYDRATSKELLYNALTHFIYGLAAIGILMYEISKLIRK